ncbi:MAG: hypothetical protein JWQ98_1832 [Chlorobi bacterium]|nr:hypothetical protein [Chlorobiota bacterium]
MKRSLLALVPAITIAALMVGCKGKVDDQPPVVKGYTTFTDELAKFSVRYPSDWKPANQAGTQVDIYSRTSVADAFSSFKPNKERGAKIEIRSVKGDQAAMDSSISELHAQFTDASVFKAPEKTSINGMPATKLSYGFEVEDTKFQAERYYVVTEGSMTYLETAVIGEYANYAAIFDTARASFKPGVFSITRTSTDTSNAGGAVRDSQIVEVASPDLKPFSNPNFQISYPGNFSPTTRAGKKLADVSFSGLRNDSYFQVGVDKLPDGVTLDKVVESNKGRFGGHPAAKTTLGGQPAYIFSYQGAKDVSSRAYFMAAGGKLYQITANWYKPQEANYLPAFEKALQSFKAK